MSYVLSKKSLFKNSLKTVVLGENFAPSQKRKSIHPCLNVREWVGFFNQEKALVEAFSVTVKTLPMVRLQLLRRVWA